MPKFLPLTRLAMAVLLRLFAGDLQKRLPSAHTMPNPTSKAPRSFARPCPTG